MSNMRLHVRVSPTSMSLLDKAAAPGDVSKSALVDAAIQKMLAPKPDASFESALTRRLDKMSKSMERYAYDAAALTETLALFVLYYLCITPPLPEDHREGAEALGRKRFDHFISQVGDRLMGEENYSRALLHHMGLEDISTTAERRVANGASQ